MKKVLQLLACLLAVPIFTAAGEHPVSGTITVSPFFLQIQPSAEPDRLLRVMNKTKEVLSVAPDGEVRLNGIAIDKLNTDEARIAFLALAKYLLKLDGERVAQNMAFNCEWELRRCDAKVTRMGLDLQGEKVRADSCETRELFRKALNQAR